MFCKLKLSEPPTGQLVFIRILFCVVVVANRLILFLYVAYIIQISIGIYMMLAGLLGLLG